MKLYYFIFLTLFILEKTEAGHFPTGPFFASEIADSENNPHDDTDHFYNTEFIIGDDLKLEMVGLAQSYVKKFVLPSQLSLAQKALTVAAVSLLPNQEAVVGIGPVSLTARQAAEKAVSICCMASVIFPRFFKAPDKREFIKETIVSLAKEPAISVSYNRFVDAVSRLSGSTSRLNLYPAFIENNEYLQAAVRYVWRKHVREGVNTIIDLTTKETSHADSTS